MTPYKPSKRDVADLTREDGAEWAVSGAKGRDEIASLQGALDEAMKALLQQVTENNKMRAELSKVDAMDCDNLQNIIREKNDRITEIEVELAVLRVQLQMKGGH